MCQYDTLLFHSGTDGESMCRATSVSSRTKIWTFSWLDVAECYEYTEGGEVIEFCSNPVSSTIETCIAIFRLIGLYRMVCTESVQYMYIHTGRNRVLNCANTPRV